MAHLSWVGYAWLHIGMQGLRPCVTLESFFSHLCICPALIATPQKSIHLGIFHRTFKSELHLTGQPVGSDLRQEIGD